MRTVDEELIEKHGPCVECNGEGESEQWTRVPWETSVMECQECEGTGAAKEEDQTGERDEH